MKKISLTVVTKNDRTFKRHTEELDDNLPVRYVTCCYLSSMVKRRSLVNLYRLYRLSGNSMSVAVVRGSIPLLLHFNNLEETK